MLLSHMHVVSNFMEFDPSPPHQITGFTPPLIHTLNKGIVKLENTPFCDQADVRNNVIVIGDSIGDLEMGSTLNHRTRLTIGFLNQNIPANLEEYTDKFDIVLTNDSAFDWLNSFLSLL
ncbi:7-methylguanosine phosphate-specific 5'-nucleotidase [Entomophthora muscae]|uniref:7-methylguanosine phosphate-specific 5'-nucleotidase n=1 Tax=Entomophthora muscae TaxID=34485 RepID=A0ACC2SIV8_9FUNG|nr:7-methylguanosine phosphate-specific 5'-nucleotidase [Entomophthora muscae]